MDTLITEMLDNAMSDATDNVIEINKDIRYINDRNTHFIGVFENDNRKIEYKFGILIKLYDNFTVTLYGYFDNIYFYGSKETYYKKNINNLIEEIQKGYFKYNCFTDTYEVNGYVENTRINIYNQIHKYKEDLFNTPCLKKNFKSYHKKQCEHCNLRECNMINGNKYVCIQCDRGLFIQERTSRYYFDTSKNIINNRAVIDDKSILYKVGEELFIKKINEKNQTLSLNKLELIENDEETINYYNSLTNTINFIVNNIDLKKINADIIIDFKERFYI